MSDTALAYAVQNLDLQRLQNEQLTLYNIYNNMLTSGSHAQLCAKALEVIRARERTNRKIDAMNCDATVVAVCFVLPLLCLPAMLKDYDYDADHIATGLHAEHLPASYKRCGAIVEQHRPNQPTVESYKTAVAEVVPSTPAPQQRPSVTETSPQRSSVMESSSQRTSLTESSQTLTTTSPFAVLDEALECAFSGKPKAGSTAPVVKLLRIDNMSDSYVIEEVEHGLMNGSVIIVLSQAVVDRRLPEVLFDGTGAVCWDVFRTKARRVPIKVADSRIKLRLMGDGKLVFVNTDLMTVLGGFLDGDVFVLGTFRAVMKGEPERDFILNCYRDGSLCRVYYTKAPRGGLKVREFFRETLGIHIKPLPQGAFYDLHSVGCADECI